MTRKQQLHEHSSKPNFTFPRLRLSVIDGCAVVSLLSFPSFVSKQSLWRLYGCLEAFPFLALILKALLLLGDLFSLEWLASSKAMAASSYKVQILWIFCKKISSNFPFVLNLSFNLAQKTTFSSVRYSGGIWFPSSWDDISTVFLHFGELLDCHPLQLHINSTLSIRGIWKSSQISCDICKFVRPRFGPEDVELSDFSNVATDSLSSVWGGGTPPPSWISWPGPPFGEWLPLSLWLGFAVEASRGKIAVHMASSLGEYSKTKWTFAALFVATHIWRSFFGF